MPPEQKGSSHLGEKVPEEGFKEAAPLLPRHSHPHQLLLPQFPLLEAQPTFLKSSTQVFHQHLPLLLQVKQQHLQQSREGKHSARPPKAQRSLQVLSGDCGDQNPCNEEGVLSWICPAGAGGTLKSMCTKSSFLLLSRLEKCGEPKGYGAPRMVKLKLIHPLTQLASNLSLRSNYRASVLLSPRLPLRTSQVS